MKKLLALPLICFFTLLSCNSEPQTFDELTSSIEEFLENEEGTYGIAFKDLNNPDNEFYMNADTLFHAASTMKTPVMIEIFKKAEAGHFSMSDSVLIENEFKSIVDSSSFQLPLDPEGDDPYEAQVGENATIYDLTHAMITYSSNLATNLMIQLADAEETTQTMRELGAKNIEVLRGVEDLKAFDQGLSNRTTPRDLEIILRALADGKAVSQKSDSTMIEIMKDQFYRDIIPFHLPKDLEIANKTGFITGVRHDSAIVYLPDGRSYVLIFLTKELPDENRGQENGATISEMIYDFYVAN
ncbi:MAG: serine hydrolase [Balneolaceae bacterium]